MFVQLIITVSLQVNNKDEIIQTLIIHDALHRRKVFIDCFCKGLEVYGLYTLMKGFPDLFERVFISNEITCDEVINSITLPTLSLDYLDDDECSIVLELYDYIKHLSTQSQ